VVVLAGDFNIGDPELRGYSSPTDGIDHVLVRGARVAWVAAWTNDRRLHNGVVLSDHPIVEVSVETVQA
jgi:hypothetical protein